VQFVTADIVLSTSRGATKRVGDSLHCSEPQCTTLGASSVKSKPNL
jgi:hypothetical protein